MRRPVTPRPSTARRPSFFNAVFDVRSRADRLARHAAIPLRAVPLLAGAALLSPRPARRGEATDVSVMTRNLFLGADLPPLASPSRARTSSRRRRAARRGHRRRPRRAHEARRAARSPRPSRTSSACRRSRCGAPGRRATRARDRRALRLPRRTIRKELKPPRTRTTGSSRRQRPQRRGADRPGVDVRLTLGDVILVRKGVKVAHARSGRVQAPAAISTPRARRRQRQPHAGTRSTRPCAAPGSTSSTPTSRPTRPTSASTRPRSWSKGPLKSKRQTILVGDLNSGPDLEDPGDRPPYQAIADAGFKPRRTPDVVLLRRPRQRRGLGPQRRLDHVQAGREARRARRSPAARRPPTGLHPSDHGGVVSVLRVKR